MQTNKHISKHPVNKVNSNLTSSEILSSENRSFKRRGRLPQKIRRLRYWRSVSLLRRVSFTQRLISLLLLLSLFSTTVAASPDASRTIIVSLGELHQDLRFGLAAYHAGGTSFSSVISGVYGFFLKSLGRQQKVERVVILPTDEKGTLTIMQGEQVNFTAIGLLRDEPQSGLTFSWSINQLNRNSEVNQKNPGKPLLNGVFKAERPGIFVVTAAVGESSLKLP